MFKNKVVDLMGILFLNEFNYMFGIHVLYSVWLLTGRHMQ